MDAWLTSIFIGSGFIFAGIIFRFFLLKELIKISSKTQTKMDDLIFETMQPYILAWFFLAGLYFASHYAPVSLKVFGIIKKTALITFILSCCFAITRFLSNVIRSKAHHSSVKHPTTSLTENMFKIFVFGLGLLLILSDLGISITPILTALGVGSLAVALALKDTLSDLFSGVYIILNRQVRIGDYIKLNSGQEGYVVDIGWKMTKVRELANNIIAIPNSSLSQAILTNYYLPEKEMSIVFPVGVSYGSDLKKVETVTVEVAQQIQKEVPGGIPSFEPVIRYHTFGDFSINFSVIFRIQEYTDQYLIKHEFVKRLHERYKTEGIQIPFPQRVIHQRQE